MILLWIHIITINSVLFFFFFFFYFRRVCSVGPPWHWVPRAHAHRTALSVSRSVSTRLEHTTRRCSRLSIVRPVTRLGRHDATPPHIAGCRSSARAGNRLHSRQGRTVHNPSCRRDLRSGSPMRGGCVAARRQSHHATPTRVHGRPQRPRLAVITEPSTLS